MVQRGLEAWTLRLLAVRPDQLSYETHGMNPGGARNLRVPLQLAALEIARAKPRSCHAQEAAAQGQLNRISFCRFSEESRHVGIPSLMSISKQDTNSAGACENASDRRDSNPCGQSPMDFESISLAARTQCHWCDQGYDISCMTGAHT